MSSSIQVVKVDYKDADQVTSLVAMLQMYAEDPMGGGGAIAKEVITKLPAELQKRSFMHSFLVFENDQAIAFSNCIESFSTFSARSVLNIHDFAVRPQSRGKNVSQILLNAIQEFAVSIGCNKLTLEVLQNNQSAKRAYEKAGFTAYQLNPEMGNAEFWQKSF